MTPSPEEPFELLRSALDAAGVRYAVGGSWASNLFGDARYTNDVDIVADFDSVTLHRFLDRLPTTFYADVEEAYNSLRHGRAFNVIYQPIVVKFDLFPATAFPIGRQEIDRAIIESNSGLTSLPTPFVTPEDILLAKLHWYRRGGEISSVQWRDIQGVVRIVGGALDRQYLADNAVILGVDDLLQKAFSEVGADERT